MGWSHLFFILGGLLMAWVVFQRVKNNPQAFSRENLSKSFFTLGVLALLLIGFIWLLVLLLH